MSLEEKKKLLVIAGSDNYPKLVIEGARDNGVEHIEVIAFKGETNSKNINRADVVHWMRVGQLQLLLDCITETKINELMMVGQISPKNVFSIKLDKKMKTLIHSLPILNAHTIFSSIVKEIEDIGIEVIPAHSYIDKLMPAAGVLTNRPLTKNEENNTAIGVDFIKANSSFDIGQTVAIKSGYIVAVEAMEGTNKTIRRAGKVAGSGTTIVKVPKENHNFKFDIPVIGPNTIQEMVKAKASCISLKEKKALIFDFDKTIKIANNHNIAILVME